MRIFIFFLLALVSFSTTSDLEKANLRLKKTNAVLLKTLRSLTEQEAVGDSSSRETGAVIFYENEKGYGYIQPNGGGEQVFADWSDFDNAEYVVQNDVVSYEPVWDDVERRTKAVDIIVLQRVDTATGGKGKGKGSGKGTGMPPPPSSKGAVAVGDYPTLDDKVVDAEFEEEKKLAMGADVHGFAVGEIVRVTTGPFADFTGTVEKIDLENSTLKVGVSIFGRQTPVELEFSQVEKLD